MTPITVTSPDTHPDLPTVVVDLDLNLVGSYGRDVALLGTKFGGRDLIWDRRQSAFLLASGEQGSGKTILFNVIQVHDLAVGNIIVIIGIKPGDSSWLKGKVSRAITPQGWLRALRWVDAQLHERKMLCEEHGVPDIALVDPDTPWVTLYLDEAPGLWGDEALLDLGKDGRDEAVRMSGRIAKQGRAFRVTMVASTQYPTIHGTFGHHSAGGAVRRNFNARVHFDTDTDGLIAAFDGLITNRMARLLEIPEKGRCGALHLSAEDGSRAVPAQVWHITHDLAAPFAAAYQGPPPIQFDPLPAKEFTP